MVSAVKSRPNHYETLGLQPTAGSAEITHAFAREISAARPRAIGGLAAVSIAYETLRDPVRRRAYDVSLGIKSLPQLTPSVTARMGRPSFLAAPPADDPLKAPAPPEPAVQADREPATDPELPPFIAARLRDLAAPTPRETNPAPDPERLRSAELQPEPMAEPQVIVERDLADGLDERPDDAEAGPTWTRPAMIAGALVLAVGSVGAWAGWTGGNEIQPDEPRSVAKVSLGPAVSVATTAAPADSQVDAVAEAAVPRRAQRPAITAAPVKRARAAPQPATADAKQFDVAIPAAAPDPAIAQATDATPKAVAASLPLSNRVIARTIEKIGYACGEIASTADGGAPGVFNVTCTSGNSYRASPVRGRYRFRRLSGG